MMVFRPGRSVRRKADAQIMTVVAINPANGTHTILCEWLDAKNGKQHSWFRREDLGKPGRALIFDD